MHGHADTHRQIRSRISQASRRFVAAASRAGTGCDGGGLQFCCFHASEWIYLVTWRDSPSGETSEPAIWFEGFERNEANARSFACRLRLLSVSHPIEEEKSMSLRINDIAPDFTAETTQGTIHFHDWIGDGWAVLFSHPKNFTPVCTTELGAMAGLDGEFRKRGVKVIGISVDPVESHAKWKNDIRVATGFDVEYPLIGDRDLKVAKLYDMLPAGAGDTSEGRTPADNATVRSVFVIGPDKKIKLILTYPMTTGRNFAEILRAIDSIQLTAKHQVATPANWSQGDDVIITAAVSNEDAIARFGSFDTVLPYLRKTKQPAG
jgi:alkyl hydroperoxide reductase subunit AhpC